jgi:isoquinoline 1-oxidoreductase subunit beta
MRSKLGAVLTAGDRLAVDDAGERAQAGQGDVYKLLAGGGFGRRGRSEYVSHAVRIAKEMPGTPIKLIKSREDDTANGVYHPITQCRLIGAFDADNNLTGLHMRISG